MLCQQYSSAVAYTTNILGAEPFILWLQTLVYTHDRYLHIYMAFTYQIGFTKVVDDMNYISTLQPMQLSIYMHTSK